MKNIFLVITTISMLGIACVKEQTPAGLVLGETIAFTDSTYTISNLPTPQASVIFIEEATGVHCVNCPAGATELKNLKNANPNRILSTAVYSPFLNQFEPPSKYDFNSQDAFDLVVFLGNGDPSKPAAAINRISSTNNQANTGNAFFYNREEWSGVIQLLINKSTPVNIDLTAQKDTTTYTINTKIVFTENYFEPLAISLFLIEDDVEDLQDSNTGEIENYIHNHILRKIITPLAGTPFLADVPSITKGTVLQRKFYNIRLPKTIVDSKNCHVICVVNKIGASREVLHAAEIHLPS
jgi:hypothetical protein